MQNVSMHRNQRKMNKQKEPVNEKEEKPTLYPMKTLFFLKKLLLFEKLTKMGMSNLFMEAI